MGYDFPLSASDIAILGFLNIGVFISAVLVLMMQPGFMLFESGVVSRKNVLNNIFKNVADLSVGGIVFFMIGAQTLTGEGPIIALLEQLDLTQAPAPDVRLHAVDPLLFLFNFGFATASATICSGAVTGRISPYVYLIFAMIFIAVIYPVLGFLFWNPASVFYGTFTDFAGAVIVHGAGAAGGLAGALLLRPRIGFNGYNPVGVGGETLFRLTVSHAPHNMPLAALGAMLLWLGWFGFNSGTVLAGGVPAGFGVGLEAQEAEIGVLFSTFGVVSVNTALAPCAAVATMVLIQFVRRRPLNMIYILNSIIAGLVAVTAAADALSSGGALLVGAAAAVVFMACARLLVLLSIDDPVSVIAAHGAPAFVAAAAAGFASSDPQITILSQLTMTAIVLTGVFVASIFAFQIASLVFSLFALVLGVMGFGELWRSGAMRVPPETEIDGLDEKLHGQDGYNMRDAR